MKMEPIDLKPWTPVIGAVIMVLAVGGLIVQSNISSRPKVDLDGARISVSEAQMNLEAALAAPRLPLLFEEVATMSAALERCGIDFSVINEQPTDATGAPLGPADSEGGARWHYLLSGSPRALISCVRMLLDSHEIAILSGSFTPTLYEMTVTLYGSLPEATP